MIKQQIHMQMIRIAVLLIVGFALVACSSSKGRSGSKKRAIARADLLETRAVRLEDLKPREVSVADAGLRVNETKWGLPFYNQGKAYEKGLWAPAPSKVDYALGGQYKSFSVLTFVSAFAGDKRQVEAIEREFSKRKYGTVKFVISGDGRTLYESRVTTYATGVKKVSVDVKGVQMLSLEVRNVDDRELMDFGVWVEGILLYDEPIESANL